MKIQKLSRPDTPSPTASPTLTRIALTLLGGTGMAQTISFAFTLLLTRLYTPEIFGYFGIIGSLAAILWIVASGRYEHAILLPARLRFGMTVGALSALLCLIISLLSLIVMAVLALAAPTWFLSWASTYWVVLLLPLLTISGVWLSIGNVIANRLHAYRAMAAARIVQALITGTAQVAAATVSASVVGLAAGQVLGALVGCGVLALLLRRRWRGGVSLRWRHLMAAAKRYQRFPRYSMPADLVNVLTRRAPYFVFAIAYSPEMVGLFLLAERVVGMPSALLGQAVGEAFRNHAAARYRTHGECRALFLQVMCRLAPVAIAGYGLLAIIAPDMFALAFGERWRDAGHYATLLSLMYAGSLLSGPLSHIFFIAQQQPLDFRWQVALMATNFAVLSLAFHAVPMQELLLIYAAANALLYGVYLAMAYRIACGKRLMSPRAPGGESAA